MKKFLVLLLTLSLALCLGVTALAVEEGAETPSAGGSHYHSWTYEASGAAITQKCMNSSCNYTDGIGGTVTVVAPARTVYGGTESAEATLTGSFAEGVANPTIQYMGTGESNSGYKYTTAPENAGDYQASITMENGGGQTVTARVDYTIAKAEQDVPGAPSLSNFTAENITNTSIILTPYANADSSKGNAWVEYSLDNKATWTHGTHTEKGLVLSGLEPGTAYTIWARYEETDNYKASEPNATPLTVTTLDGEPTYILSIAADNIQTNYGAQAFTSLKITNSGNSTATITSVTLSGKDAGIYDVLRWDNPSDTVAPGATNETWFICFKSAEIETGTYNCTVTVTYNNGATATKDITAVVEKGRPAQPSYPPVIIDFAAETIRVDSSAPAEPVWAIGENRWDSGTIIGEGQSISAWLDTEGGKDLYLFVEESKNYVSSINETVMGGEAWAFVERLERPDAPTSPAKQADESIDGLNDGSIGGVTDAMEYKLQGATAWTAVPAGATEITDLADGTYLVRYKATDSAFASHPVYVTIKQGVPATYTLTASALDFGTLSYNPNAYEAKALSILSGGNSDATITRVSCTGPFEVAETGSSTVAAGGTNTSWTIRPQTGTGASSTAYTGTVTITYNNGATATAGLYVTINPAEQAAPDHHYVQDWGTTWVAYEKHENANGSPIQYSFDGGQTWLAGTPDPEDDSRMIISGLTPDTEYPVDFRYGPSPDGNYKASAAAELSYSIGITTLHEVKITQGDGQTFYRGGSQGLAFVSSDKFEDFSYLFVYAKGADMSLVSPLEAEHFTAEEGSVRITLKAEYLNSLPAGEYVLQIPCTSIQGEGAAIASFFVKEAPVASGSGGTEGEIVKTGDSRQAGLWAVLALACGGALTVSLLAGKKKQH